MNSETKTVRRFVTRVAAFLMLQLFVLFVVIRYGATGNSNEYLSAFQDKIDRLEQCRGPRLVVLGGSNVAFGVHSPLIQQAVGMETVNLGLHVALGLPFALECYRQHARSGDVVVISPEYHLLTSEELQRGDPNLVGRLIELCPESQRYLPLESPDTWKQFLDHDAVTIAHQWVGRAFRSIRQRDDKQEKVYSRRAFNEFGDVIAHHGRISQDWVSSGPIPDIRPEVLEETIAVLNQFCAECRDHGVEVYLSYPPLAESDYTESQQVINQLHHILQQELNIPLLHPPQAFAFSRDSFFDTAYHLNDEGGKARTRRLVEAIQQHRVATRTTEKFETAAVAFHR